MAYSARRGSPTSLSGSYSQRPKLLLLLEPHLSPLLLKTFSANTAFPLTLRGTRVVFLLPEQKSAELATEPEVFLSLLFKLVSGEAETGETRPG